MSHVTFWILLSSSIGLWLGMSLERSLFRVKLLQKASEVRDKIVSEYLIEFYEDLGGKRPSKSGRMMIWIDLGLLVSFLALAIYLK